MPTPNQGVYKKAEPDTLRLRNKIMEIMRGMGGSAVISFPEWLIGATPKEFKTQIAGSLKDNGQQTMWRARGNVLCTLKFGAEYWITLKVAGRNDEELSFEIESSPNVNKPKEVVGKADANTVEHMLTTLLDGLKRGVKDMASARKAYIKV